MTRRCRLLLALPMVGLAVAAIVAILAPARADELSELRASNLALQEKLAQVRALDASPAPAPAADRGGFPGSFRIPGTRTSIRVGGNIAATGTYTMER